jgi:hypothetical protein
MDQLNADQFVCRKDFITDTVFPSKSEWKDFQVLEASGRDDLLSFLKKEFHGTGIEQNIRQERETGENMKFDYIVAVGMKYIPCGNKIENPFRRLLTRLKPGGFLAGAVCGFSGYYGLLMLGSIIEAISKNKTMDECLQITRTIIDQLPPNHPFFESSSEDVVRRLKTGDVTAFNDLMLLTRSIRHIDRLFTVSKLLDAIPKWEGRFDRWVFSEDYFPSTILGDAFMDLPEQRRAVVSECFSAAPPHHYFLLKDSHG